MAARYPTKLPVCDKRFESDGATIAYYDSGGDGDVVLLLHALGPSANMWSKISPTGTGTIESFLDKGYRVVASDMRCHGNSTHFYKHGHCGVKLCNDQINLLDKLGVKKAHIYGYSAGAHVALKTVVLHPERFKSLAIGGSGWANDLYGSGEESDYAKAALNFGKANINTCVHYCWYPCCCPCFCRCAVGEPDWDFKAQPLFVYQMNEVLNITEAELSAIPIPVIGLVGADDEEVKYVKRICGVLKDYTYIEVPNKNHMNVATDPTYVNSLSEHIDKVAGKTGPSMVAAPMTVEMQSTSPSPRTPFVASATD